ncbi:biotin--[acetyl-CoA-carboxylase] ligase [Planctomycetota bacterium]|nr:biotin--[acetyl-CoA-carboxylase] ligase [Planctomycetota bacterium]
MLVIHYEQTDSTNTQAMNLAQQYPDQVILVSADRQTSGRGRLGRNWSSPPGGAWFSLAYPSHRSPEQMQAAPLIVGIAVRDVIAKLALPQEPWTNQMRIKWPNDLLINQRKVVGILCERSLIAQPSDASSTQPSTMILGVGINANVDIQSLGPGLRTAPTSLKDQIGEPVDIADLIHNCGEEIAASMNELESLGQLSDITQARINNALAWRNKHVCLDRAGKAITGILKGIDNQGQLILETPSGRITQGSGEISKLRPIDT